MSDMLNALSYSVFQSAFMCQRCLCLKQEKKKKSDMRGLTGSTKGTNKRALWERK